eukprot:CAMPEP_0184300532 /NCGR_PEP_ID=MMETSP1049-20130417/10927_1 /TAXON_ID=77928 /ORGANISM="Proteomonas sulcata, Strain CCMP704" /LENGTH=222 /DNA_ID=CAMNT_0026611277 /DNA_START=49 /DNA_END=717 /DNA_ORIENTATION=+
MLLSAVDASHRAVLTFSKDIITGMQLGRSGSRGDSGMRKLSISLPMAPSAPQPPSSVTVVPGAPWVLPTSISGIAEGPQVEGLRPEGPRPKSARAPSATDPSAPGPSAPSVPQVQVFRRRPSKDQRPQTARPALNPSAPQPPNSSGLQTPSTTPRGTPSGHGASSVPPGPSASQPSGNMFGLRSRDSPQVGSSAPQPPGAKKMRPQSAAPNPKSLRGGRYGV